MATQLSICNQALAEIAAQDIDSIDENSLEAKTCKKFYADTLTELLEGDHAWNFATKRAPLSTSVVNGRPEEWVFAYDMPDDCAFPQRLLPNMVGGGAPVGEWADGLGRLYDIEAGTLYTSFESATLEYTANTLVEARMPALFARAFSLALAVKLVWPIKKSRELKGDLIKAAEVALQRALAADANRQPQGDNYIPEVGRVRGETPWDSRSYLPVSDPFLEDDDGTLLVDG